MKSILIFLVLFAASFAAPFLLVVDSSGSMDEYTNDNLTKMEAAKQAAKSFVDSTSSEIGLVTFGTCDSYGDINSGGIYLVENFTTDKTSLKSAIDSLEPYSSTPIADALVEAKTYLLATKGSGTIVLITDGEETCGGDPVYEAGYIYNNSIGRVNVVGFQLGDAADQEAREIAAAGGGQYYAAENAAELESALTTISYGDGLSCCPMFVLIILPLLAFAIRR